MVNKTNPIKSFQLDVGTNEGQIPVVGPGGALVATIDAADVVYDNSSSNFNSTTPQGVVDEISQIYTNSEEPTGFPNRIDSILTFTDETATVSISPVATSFSYFVSGKAFTISTTKNYVISNIEGIHYVYFDVDGELHETLDFTEELVMKPLVCIVYWDTTNSVGVYVADERHGMAMDGATHYHLHVSFGTQFISGLGLGNFSINGTGDVDANAQFSCGNGVIRDEDLQFEITGGNPQVLAPIAQIPILWRTGASGDWRKRSENDFPTLYSGDGSGYVGVGGQIPFNQFTGGTWQLTETTSGNFCLVHYFGTNDIRHPIFGIQGIAQYSTAGTARIAANSEISSLSGLPFAEFVPIGTAIFQTNGGSYSNVPHALIRSTDVDGTYVDWRTVSTFLSGSIPSDHGNLGGLADDDHLQYFNTTRGDARYYTQTQLDTRINHPSTGIFSGGVLSLGTLSGSPASTSLFSITAGTGLFVDHYTDPQHPTYLVVSWGAFTDVSVTNIATQDITFIGIDNTGSIVQLSSLSSDHHRDYILLGIISHFNRSYIEAVRNDGHPVFDVTARLTDFGHAIGSFNVSGNVYGPNDSNLMIDKSAGESYQSGANFHINPKSPDITNDIAANVVSWNYSYRDGSGGFILTTPTNTVDPGHYDNGTGTLATVSTNSWSIQTILFYPEANEHRIEYGQTVYASSTAAKAAIPEIDHTHNTILVTQGIIRCYLVVRGNATNLSLVGDATFVEATRFPGGISSIPPAPGQSYELVVAGASQTVFNLSFSFAATDSGRVYHKVFKDGIKAIEGVTYDYTVTGLSQITFNAPLTGGEVVEFYGE